VDKANFLIVDDDALLRDGLKALMQREHFVNNIYEASTMEQVEAQLRAHNIHIILLDIRLGKENGLDIHAAVKKMPFAPKVIIVTGMEGVEVVINLLKLGVSAITFKLDGYGEIVKAIKSVMAGGTYYPERITQVIRKNAHRWDRIPQVMLNSREKELLTTIAQGLTTKEIASLLKMSEATVETYRIRLMKKVGVQNAAALMAFGFSNGLL
jgi:DNA-binding NarL/FixJ family response regulator